MKRATSFKKVVLCHTNDFKPDINDKIKGWVEANGGTLVKDLTPDVTHLVASRKAWKRYHPLVRQARRTRTIRIVKYDWLEDSLMSKPVRALPEDKYLYEQTRLTPIKKAKKHGVTNADGTEAPKNIVVPKDKRIELVGMLVVYPKAYLLYTEFESGIEFDNARKEFERDMGAIGFHPYSDKTRFVYVVTLLRYDVLKSRFEKYKLKVGHNPPSIFHQIAPSVCSTLYLFPKSEPYSTSPVTALHLPRRFKSISRVHLAEPWAQCLQLYESDQQPHTYACYMQYTRPGTQKQVLTLAPPGSTWSFAWDIFTKTFLRKVGVLWDERPENGFEIRVDSKTEMEYFQYVAPKIGEPEGLRRSRNSKTSPLSQSDEVKTSTDRDVNSLEETLHYSESEATLTDHSDGHFEDSHHP